MLALALIVNQGSLDRYQETNCAALAGMIALQDVAPDHTSPQKFLPISHSTSRFIFSSAKTMCPFK